jgi:hypothetical protein
MISINHSVISSLVKKYLGDMTFSEAYEKTRRVLNVIIPFEGGRRSILMNFLTAPNVVCLHHRLDNNNRLFGRQRWLVIRKEVSQVSGAMWEYYVRMGWEKLSLGTVMVYKLLLQHNLIISWKRSIYLKSE